MPADSPASSLETTLALIHAEAQELGVGTEIPASERTALRWYFRTRGAPDGAGSGGQFERAELYSTMSRPCTRCGGDLDRWIGGCGWRPSNPRRREPNAYELSLLQWAKETRKTLPPRCDIPCKACGGRGWVEGRRKRNWRRVPMFYVSSRYVNGSRGPLKWQGPFTHAVAEQMFEDLSCEYEDVSMAKGRSLSDGFDALPTGSTVEEGASGGDDVSGHRLAVISGRLDLMFEWWPTSVDVLDSRFGEDSNGLTSIWPLTGPGKTLLRRNKSGVPVQQFFVNERINAEDQQDGQRLALFDQADADSRILLNGACALWNIVSDSDLSSIDAPNDEVGVVATT